MAIIPGTKYAEGAPTASTGQTLLRPPENTGGEQVAAQIGKLGAVVTAYAINVQKKEQMADFYEKKRQMDENGWAAYESMTGDEESDNKTMEQLDIDLNKIAQSSKYVDTNELLQEHRNKVMPNWLHGMRVKSLGIRSENAEQQSEYEAQELLSKGQVDDAVGIYNRLISLGNVEKKAYYEKLIKEAPVESQLKIAERMIDTGKQENALKELDKINETKATNNQLKYRTSLRNRAQTVSVNKQQEAIRLQQQDIENHTQKLINGEILNPIEIEKGNIVIKERKEQWQRIVKAQKNEPAKKTSWKIFNDIQNDFFKYWHGDYGYDREGMETKLATEYLVNRSLSTNEYKELISRLDIKLSKTTRDNLQSIFKESEDRTETFFGKATERTADINRALLEKAIQMDKNGKDYEYNDMFKDMINLINSKKILQQTLQKVNTTEDLSQLSDEELLKKIMGK